jgi:predicted AAA+ superfamily ATPase
MLTMIARRSHVANILERLRDFPVVALLGARQIGKTTLAGLVAKKHGRTV